MWFSFNDTHLQRVLHIKLLYITIGNNLSFAKHCGNIASLGRRHAFMLFGSFPYISLEIMVVINKIFIRSLLEHCTSVYSPQARNEINQTESIQHFFTRSLPGLSAHHFHACFNRLYLHSPEFRHIFNDCIFMYKKYH